ncbi:MAG TPA: FecR domain-containing protein [Gammaproteobacteria bacterium]|nr:FecR domain-containing protein [Gammaproteobacteria bacterium]
MRNPHQQSAETRVRTQQAAEWLLRLHEPGIDSLELSAWLEWTRRDPLNFDAFERIQDLESDLKALGRDRKAALLHRYLEAGELAQPPQIKSRNARRWRYIAAAASLAVGLAALAYATVRAPHATQLASRYIASQAQNRQVMLPDGTQIELGARSRLRVSYRPDVRRVDLLAGEAYFQVRHNEERPFVVRAAGLRVKDVGTAFDVRRNDDQVVVKVAEGKVDVAYAEPARNSNAPAETVAAPISLTAGQQVVASPRDATLNTDRVDVNSIAAWRHGRLHFRDVPLAVVIANVNRYASQQIVLADPAVGRLRYTGTVFVNRINGWLAAVQAIFPVRAARDELGAIRLYSRSPS